MLFRYSDNTIFLSNKVDDLAFTFPTLFFMISDFLRLQMKKDPDFSQAL